MRWKERPIEHFKDTAGRTRKQNWGWWNTNFAGTMAGYVHKHGYRVLKVDGQKYMSHRVAFYMGNGVEPRQVDHLDGVKDDNRLSELACVDAQGNAMNRTMSKANKSGVTGVYYLPKVSKPNPWQATGMANGVYTYLGSHPTLFEAACARLSWQNRNGFTLRHGR